MTFRPPSVLSKLALTADRISDGRIEVGLGTGWDEAEHTAYQLPFPALGERMTMLERQLRILHEHCSDERYQPAPVQQPRLPLLVGGSGGSRGIAIAAHWADEYNTANVLPDEAARRRNELHAACRRAERPPIRFSVKLDLVLAADRKAACERGRRIVQQLGRPFDNTAVRGDVDDVVAHLRRYEEVGVDRITLGHLMHRDLETVELLGAEVAPQLAA